MHTFEPESSESLAAWEVILEGDEEHGTEDIHKALLLGVYAMHPEPLPWPGASHIDIDTVKDSVRCRSSNSHGGSTLVVEGLYRVGNSGIWCSPPPSKVFPLVRCSP
jgi:hypothetical protein